VSLITAFAVQVIPYAAAASLRRDDPGAIEPGRLMAHMLLVSTFQICYPILSFVLMKTDDLRCTVAWGESYCLAIASGS